MQIPFYVDSGKIPRKVEIERRKREYAMLAANVDSLLKEMSVDTQVTLPLTGQNNGQVRRVSAII